MRANVLYVYSPWTTEEPEGARLLMSCCRMGSLSQVWRSSSRSRQSLKVLKLSIHQFHSSRASFWLLRENWASAWRSEEESLLTDSRSDPAHSSEPLQVREEVLRPDHCLEKEQRNLPPNRWKHLRLLMSRRVKANEFTMFTFPLQDKKPEQRKLLQLKGRS